MANYQGLKAEGEVPISTGTLRVCLQRWKDYADDIETTLRPRSRRSLYSQVSARNFRTPALTA